MVKRGWTLEGVLSSPWAPLFLFTLALFARLAAIPFVADFSPGVQIWEYGIQGLCAAETRGDLCMRAPDGAPYASALMPPLTSYLWLGLFSLFGQDGGAHVAYVCINVMLGALCAPLLYALSRESGFDRSASTVAGAIIAVYPTFVAVSSTYHATNFTVTLMLGAILMFLRTLKTLDWRLAVAAGVLTGLSAMTRNELLLVGLALGLMLIWSGRSRFKAMALAAAAFAVGAGAVITPWTVRNAVTFERFIPIGGQGGFNLWMGLGPYAEASGTHLDRDPAASANGAIRASVPATDAPGARYETRVQDVFAEQAKAAIAEGGAGRVVRLTAEKLVLTLIWDWNDPMTHSIAYWGPWLMAHALALFALAMLTQKRISVNREALIVFALCVAILVLSYATFGVFIRYRMHFEPFVFVVAALGATQVLALWRDRKPALTLRTMKQ